SNARVHVCNKAAAGNPLLICCGFAGQLTRHRTRRREFAREIMGFVQLNSDDTTCGRGICCLFLADSATQMISPQPQVDDATLFPAGTHAYHRRKAMASAEKE